MTEFNLQVYKKKVFKTISKYKLIEKGDKLFVGLSGGKDSVSASFLISEYLKENKIDAQIFCFYLKLGNFISDDVLKIIKKQAEMCRMELKVYNISDFGIDFEKITKLKRPVCSSCGTIKRYLMNKIPREEGATKVCTGHHGDDFIVFFIKNIIGKNIGWISKFTPYLKGEGKQMSRIRPLFFVGGDDNKNFCETIGLPYINEDICPHKFLKQKIDKRREKWYKTIQEITKWQPNFREYFLEGVIEISKNLSLTLSEPKECELCKEPTNTKICSYCRLLQLHQVNKQIKV